MRRRLLGSLLPLAGVPRPLELCGVGGGFFALPSALPFPFPFALAFGPVALAFFGLAFAASAVA